MATRRQTPVAKAPPGGIPNWDIGKTMSFPTAVALQHALTQLSVHARQQSAEGFPALEQQRTAWEKFYDELTAYVEKWS